MARKGYPFSKRDTNKGNKLISNLLSGALLSPFALLETVDTSVDTSMYNSNENILYTPRKLSPSKEICIHLLYNVAAFLSLVFIIFLLKEQDWWLFFSLIIYLPLSIITNHKTLFLRDYLEKEYIFNRKILKEQIRACYIINRMCLVSYIIQFVIFFSLIAFAKGHYSFLSFLFVILIAFPKTIVLRDLYILNKHIKESIYSNPSLLKFSTLLKKVSVDLLFELMDNTDYTISLYKGFTLQYVSNSQLMKCGFLLTDKLEDKEYFLYKNYVSTPSEVVRDGTLVLSKVANSINYTINSTI